MIPQSHFMVVAPIIDGRVDGLRTLLASMNDYPGMARPDNAIVPFGAFENLHFARLVVLDDQTLGDFAEFGAPIPNFSTLLAFLGDCDGPGDAVLAEMARVAAPGLRQIFSHCEGFAPNTDLLAWMTAHAQPPAASYVNWVGRTVTQIREEARLRDELVRCANARQTEFATYTPRAIREKLVALCQPLVANGTLPLTRAPRTPLGWSVRNALHYAVLPALLLLPWLLALPVLPLHPLVLLVVPPFAVLGIILFLILLRHIPAAFATLVVLGVWLVPFFILFPLLLIPVAVVAGVFLLVLRHYEKTEVEVIHRPQLELLVQLAALEDHDVVNQYTALGGVKPSRFRRALFPVLLWFIDYFARHIYVRGHLGRVRTIHFARWAFLGSKDRLMFMSNYDGSHESYMDDFINKAGWGINVAFTCGLGYPRTRWIVKDGIEDELKFKYTQRRHQKATETWYRAYPGLTVYDLERNTRVREGFERRAMTDDEAREWLCDL